MLRGAATESASPRWGLTKPPAYGSLKRVCVVEYWVGLGAYGERRWSRNTRPCSPARTRTTSTMSHGTPPTLTSSAPPPKKTVESCSGMPDVSSSLVFRVRSPNSNAESRYTQQCSLKVSPVQTNYSPDGRALLYTSMGHQLFFLTLGKEGDDAKEAWHPSQKDAVIASTAVFNHVGDGIVLTHHSEHTLRVIDYPSLVLRESSAAHVGGCVAVALDPRGR